MPKGSFILKEVLYIQKVLMHSSYPQTDEQNCFPELETLKITC